jgi:hypothetical protein
MNIIALIVFTIPAVELVLAVALRVLFARQSTARHLKSLARFGIKLQLCQTPLTFLCISCYLLAPLFIPFGWLWFGFGTLMMVSFAIFLLMPAAEAIFPSEDSKESSRFSGAAQKTGNPGRTNPVTVESFMDIITGASTLIRLLGRYQWTKH